MSLELNCIHNVNLFNFYYLFPITFYILHYSTEKMLTILNHIMSTSELLIHYNNLTIIYFNLCIFLENTIKSVAIILMN